MGDSGTKPIRHNRRLLAVKGLLALFVAWGAIAETTRPLFAPFLLPPRMVAELYARTKYTWVTFKYEQRGWPLVFSIRTNAPRGAAGFGNEDSPIALAIDLALVAFLAFAAWNLPRGWRWQFGLADAFVVIASFAVMTALQLQAFGHEIDYPKVAFDVGVFSAAIISIRCLRMLIWKIFDHWIGSGTATRRPLGMRLGTRK